VATACDSGRTFSGCWSKYPQAASTSAAPATADLLSIVPNFPSPASLSLTLTVFGKGGTRLCIFPKESCQTNDCFTKVAE
jgi:hypothetical protein